MYFQVCIYIYILAKTRHFESKTTIWSIFHHSANPILTTYIVQYLFAVLHIFKHPKSHKWNIPRQNFPLTYLYYRAIQCGTLLIVIWRPNKSKPSFAAYRDRQANIKHTSRIILVQSTAFVSNFTFGLPKGDAKMWKCGNSHYPKAYYERKACICE